MTRRDSYRGARCLVTGASSGLGAAFARLLAARGARLVLTGRSVIGLKTVADAILAAGDATVDLLTVDADLTAPDDRRRVLEATDARFDGALDLVVNAAGVGAYGRFESHDPSVLRRVFEINLFALAEICRGSLPLLRRGERPSVINIGSIVARRGLPGRPEYSASKFAVAGLTESLRAEWAIDGIHLLLLNPGFTRTAFERNLVADTAVYATEAHRGMSPDAVAEAGLIALRRGRNEWTLTRQGRTLLAFNRVLPRFVDWGLSRWTRKLYGRPPAPDAGRPPEADSTASELPRSPGPR